MLKISPNADKGGQKFCGGHIWPLTARMGEVSVVPFAFVMLRRQYDEYSLTAAATICRPDIEIHHGLQATERQLLTTNAMLKLESD